MLEPKTEPSDGPHPSAHGTPAEPLGSSFEPSADALLRLWTNPPRAASLATARRDRAFDRVVRIVGTPSFEVSTSAVRLRDGATNAEDEWPTASSWQSSELVVVAVEPSAEGRHRFAHWLAEQAPDAHAKASVAPLSRQAAGLHRLWCIAAARLALPTNIRIAVVHDLVGIRLAQIGLGFGADTFAGTLKPDRKLPLAGTTRPNEATPAGIRTLIEQAGLRPGALD